MLPPSLLKTTGFLVLFQTDATAERQFRIEGVWPANLPEIAVSYGAGEAMDMQINLVVDRIIPENSVFNPQSGNAAL